MNILIADNQSLLRDGLSLWLKEIISDAIIFQADSYSQVFNILNKENNIELIIMDIEMQDMPWLSALKKIRQQTPDAKLVILTSSEDSRTIHLVLSQKVNGYILKRSDIKTFTRAVKEILDGNIYTPDTLMDIQPINNLIGKITGIKTLTNRQSQVLDLIAQGKSNKQIAYDMGVSESTVKLHINALLRSLHVSNRTQAVITAQKMGII